MYTIRRGRPLRTPKRTTKRLWILASRRSNCSITTRFARPSTAWWATFRYTWAITSPRSTVLTTVDENQDLEAYVYIPTERAAEVRMGLGIDLTDNSGKVLEKTAVDFISPEVDSTLQGILVKAPVHSGAEILRNAQIVKARVIWSTKPMAVVPVLAVIRQGEESFVFVMQKQNGMAMAHRAPVVLGDTVGNNYSIVSGLSAGDRVIVTGTQFLVDGMPVIPIGG